MQAHAVTKKAKKKLPKDKNEGKKVAREGNKKYLYV